MARATNEHPVLIHWAHDALDGIHTPIPGVDLDEAKVFVLAKPGDGPLVDRITELANLPERKSRGERILIYTDEVDARRELRKQKNLGKYEKDPVAISVREWLEMLDEHLLYGVVSYRMYGKPRDVLLSDSDVTAYYTFSVDPEYKDYEGQRRDFIQSMTKRKIPMKRPVMREVCAALNELGFPMNVQIYGVQGIPVNGQNVNRTVVDMFPRDFTTPEEEDAYRLLIDRLSKEGGLLEECALLLADPAIDDEPIEPSTANKASSVERFSEKARNGVISFRLPGDPSRERIGEKGFSAPSLRDNLLLRHFTADWNNQFATPIPGDVRRMVVYVPELIKPGNNRSFDVQRFADSNGPMEYIDVFAHQHEARKKCGWHQYKDEPRMMTVEELFNELSGTQVGIDFHFLPDEDRYRSAHRNDKEMLKYASLKVDGSTLQSYQDFIAQETPVPDDRYEFLRTLPKRDGVITKRIYDALRSDMATNGIEGDVDIYFVSSFGAPGLVIDVTLPTQPSDDQEKLLAQFAQVVKGKTNVPVIVFYSTPERTPRPDRDRDIVFREEPKRTLTIPQPAGVGLTRPVPGAKSIDDLVRGLGITPSGVKPPKEFKLPGK